VGTLGLRLLLQLGVLLDSSDELLSRSGQGNVLDSEVDSLLDVSVLDLLVDNDTDSTLRDVVDDASLSVVNLVGHSLLDSSVGLDINDVSDFVLAQIRRQFNHTTRPETACKRITRTSTETCWMTHLDLL